MLPYFQGAVVAFTIVGLLIVFYAPLNLFIIRLTTRNYSEKTEPIAERMRKISTTYGSSLPPIIIRSDVNEPIFYSGGAVSVNPEILAEFSNEELAFLMISSRRGMRKVFFLTLVVLLGTVGVGFALATQFPNVPGVMPGISYLAVASCFAVTALTKRKLQLENDLHALKLLPNFDVATSALEKLSRFTDDKKLLTTPSKYDVTPESRLQDFISAVR